MEAAMNRVVARCFVPFFALSLSLLAGCSGAPDDGAMSAESASTQSGNTSLVFAADFTQGASGPIVPGAKVTVVYEEARELCHDAFGNSATTMFWRGDDGHVSHVHLAKDPFTPTLRADITVPHGHRLVVWFHAQTVAGEENGSCDRWDSNFGQNYMFHA
jgi:hypothetical protein